MLPLRFIEKLLHVVSIFQEYCWRSDVLVNVWSELGDFVAILS
jgi:hypothetical protein